MDLDRYSVAVVGAGPAGLVATLELARRGVSNIALLEGGNSLQRRFCPVDAGRACGGCGGSCNVFKGVGGSVHYGDGVKLSKFPSGRRLAEQLGEEFATRVMEDVLEVLFPIKRPEFRLAATAFQGLRLKSYEVAELGAPEVALMLDSLLERLLSNDQVCLSTNARVASISKCSDSFEIEIVNRTASRARRIEATKVLVAAGRGGEAWWRQESIRLGVLSTPGVSSIGLRFECPRGTLRAAGLAHPDFKVSSLLGATKVKTFCFCAGVGGGRIKFTDYGQHTLLDGHVIAEEGDSQSENFALLVQLRDESGQPYDRQWIETDLLPKYRKLRRVRPGKPVAQWYEDFRANALTCDGLDRLIEVTGLAPSVRDYELANLASILPRHIWLAFCQAFDQLIEVFAPADIPNTRRTFAVMGLELEGLWQEADLMQSMETTVPGLYLAGDCTGIAQGILQSAVSGLVAARSIADSLT